MHIEVFLTCQKPRIWRNTRICCFVSFPLMLFSCLIHLFLQYMDHSGLLGSFVTTMPKKKGAQGLSLGWRSKCMVNQWHQICVCIHGECSLVLLVPSWCIRPLLEIFIFVCQQVMFKVSFCSLNSFSADFWHVSFRQPHFLLPSAIHWSVILGGAAGLYSAFTCKEQDWKEIAPVDFPEFCTSKFL